jgi:hypothetical protein
MSTATRFCPANQLETPVVLMACPQDLTELATAERQQEMRRIYNRPGVIVMDNAIGEPILSGLREGLSDQRRKFKEKFNHGLPQTDTFRRAHKEVSKRITELTRMAFGYELPEVSARSYRPMITENEPLHYDTYDVACGTFSLMSVLNFDIRPRVWKIGPSFREICRDSRQEVEEILKTKHPGESPSVPLRSAGLRGTGPLKAETPLHEIEFAPGAVWYANPKMISHQIVFGGGAYFEQWAIDAQECECQSCIIEQLGLTVPNLRTPVTAVAA